MNILLLGPQGSGKGTQAKRIASDYGIPHIATGDIFREAMANGTPLGEKVRPIYESGSLVPDELTIALIRERLAEDDAENGFVLDGFPRTIPQAEALNAVLEPLGRRLTAVLSIEAPDEEVVRRLSGRRMCEKKGHVYHVEFDPPKNPGFCDQDGSVLVQREDDREETVRHRLHVFHEQTKPLIDYYEKRGLLRRFDGTRTPEEVHGHIRATLATLRLEEEL